MNRIVLALIGILLLALDVGLGGMLSLGAARPSLLLPFVVYIGLKRGPVDGTLFGAALGIARDALGALPLGATAFVFCVAGFACGKLWSEGSFRLVWPWGTLLAAAALWSEVVTHYLIARGTGLDFLPLLQNSGLPAAAYTTAIGLLWFLSPLHRVRAT